MAIKMISTLTASACLLFASTSFAADSMQHFSQAATHSAQATTNTVSGGAKLASGAAAVPFKAIAVVGEASARIAEPLWNSATGQKSGSLEVSDESVTAGPAPALAVAAR
ncbi:hypothetical protein [Hahella chejuensis]|uniref:hypothetical protein n=1 Tax=Hahella chejuensis TaxID=158327 RepID=UPI0011D15EDE|nr:hypothetical protein [Hahella chejuensis]